MSCNAKNCPAQIIKITDDLYEQWDCEWRKPKTNGDRIRAMTDEELAMWINDVTTNALSVLALGSNKQTKTIFYWLDWLKQEAE